MVRPVLPPQTGATLTGGIKMIRNKPCSTVYGIDLGKNLFHVVGTDDREHRSAPEVQA